jgi:hypothetical protein
MDNKVTLWVSSGKELGAPVKTKLTIDLGNLKPEHEREYAIDSLVIKWRATYKNSKKPYPSEATYVAPIPGTRSAPVMTEDEMFSALAKKYTPEQFEAELRRRMVGALQDKDPEDDPEMLK